MPPHFTSKKPLFKNLMLGLLSRFIGARRGAVMIYIAAMLPVLIGGALLVVDGARLFNLQTSLQKGADALALAGAKELDGKATSIVRSGNAIDNLVQNQSKFGAGGIADIAVTRRWLSGLPPDDADDVTGFVTADPALAQYVEVTVTPVTLNTIFPAAFVGASNVVRTAATAIAGFNSVVCEFTPMFICNPFEDPTVPGDILDAIGNSPQAQALRRRLIDMRMQGGGGGQYSPGNYGFLEPVDSNPGADALRDMIGMSNPPACFSQGGVTLRPGFVATVRDAVNTRFDMYNGPMNSNKNNPQFRPAQNVRKGYTGPDCNPSPDGVNAKKLGRDLCFDTASCPYMGGRMGDGNWDLDDYWNTNFSHRLVDKPNAPISRYDVYRHELALGLHTEYSGGNNALETGEPVCSTEPTNDNPDRRTIFGAVLNCVALGIDGGRAGPYPVHAFVKFFITEPVEAGPEQDIFAEIVDVFEPGADGANVVRDDVQLYR